MATTRLEAYPMAEDVFYRIREITRTTRRFVKSVIGSGKFYRAEIRCPYIRLGSRNAGFVVNPELLGRSSVIYSFGIGTDISFDLECVKRFSAQVHAFDPTPRSLEWIRNQDIPPEIHVHPYGLANFNGSLTLHPPADPKHVSYSLIERSGNGAECTVYTLSSIMRLLGHDHIDLLKMDIEGCEYDVMSDFLGRRIPIQQICVEFHHRWREIGHKKTESAIEALRGAGYRIFHVSPLGEEFSFICERPNPAAIES
jgi:FkbM family methyltransferase